MTETKFSTGATRFIRDKDGWYLLPYQAFTLLALVSDCPIKSTVLENIGKAVRATTETERGGYLTLALAEFTKETGISNVELLNAYAEVLYDGMQVHTAFNWEQGIPFESFISSAYRHYVKFNAGWDDENHLGSFLFNLIGAIIQHTH